MKKISLALILFLLVTSIFFGCSNSNSDKANNIVSNTIPLKSSNYDILNISVDVGGVIIKEGEGFSLSVENIKNEWLTVKSDNSVLNVKYGPEDPDDIKGIDTSAHKIIITVPYDHNTKELTVEAGTGDMSVKDLTCEKLSLHCGTGNSEMSNTQCSNLSIECGSGVLQFSGIKVNETTDINMGSGSAKIEGALGNNVSVEGGTGDLNLDISGDKADYCINGEFPTRSVYVNGEKISGSADPWENGGSSSGNCTKERAINIEGGVGDININFK